MYNNSSDHELERNTILNRSGNSFKRTKIQLRKAMSECDETRPYDPAAGMHYVAPPPQQPQPHRNSVRETNFHSPVKKKTKNSVAFTQPLLQQSPQITNHPHHLHSNVDEFKKFNTIKTPDYLLAQQQRIKEYSNGGRNNTDVSYSDTYSSSSSDYRSVAVVKPQSSSTGTNASTGPGGKMGPASKLHGSKNSLLTRKSTQSLCSCDAETELIPDPLRPLYQYSLDRKKTRHTYTCEQNAQILLRLEKEHQKKYGSAGRLFSASSLRDLDTRRSYGSAINLNTNSFEDTASRQTNTNRTNIPNYNHDNNNEQNNSLDYQNNSSSTANSSTDARQPTFVATIYRRTDSSGIHGNYSYDAGNCAAEEMVNNDMIPHAPPPPLTRKLSFNAHLPSYSNSINRQVVHQQPVSNNNKNVAFSKLNKRGETNGVAGGMQMNYPTTMQQQAHHQLLNNKPDLFNFSSTGQATVTLPSTTTKSDNKNKLLINDDASDINMKPYPPFYFDDNHLPPPPHHCLAATPGVTNVNNKENELFFYHHEPANYIPNNYDQFGGWGTTTGGTLQGPHSGKYNTIGSHHSINSKFHASGCNLHDTNLLTGHNFSTSLSNFNQQLTPHAYHQFHSGTLGYGGSSLIGGSFNSNGSLGEKRGSAGWKHRSNCPSRNSSSSGTNSGKWDLPSRQWLAVTSILLITAAAGVAVPLALRVSAGAPLEERLEVATQLLESVPLIDGHNDLPWNIRKFLHNKLNDFQFDGDLKQIKPWSVSQWSHTDLQRMKKGRLSAQFWAAYAPCEAQFKDAVQITIEQIDVIKRLTEQYSPQLTPCTTALHITEAHKNHQICSLIGLEGGHTLGGSLGVLRVYYELGVRYMTLTSSSCHTTWADSHNADAPKYDVKHGGLTQYGKTIIREMNRLGMIIDLSKSAVSTMKDVLQLSEAPVIFSHSSAYELCNSSRNVQNEIIQMVAKKRGIVMVNFYSKFLTCSENSTVHDAVAHINHIKRIAGVDFVGLGAGFDGINMVPQGLEDISTYPMLFAELLGTGWTIEDLTKLAGENLLRVMTEVEQVRDTQKKMGVKPFEEIPPFKMETDPFNCTTGS